MTALPMFPLNTVVFPFVYLPLRVFEPRYRALTQRCLAGDRQFGIVLIERGSEVGGGDVRFRTGTRVRIVEAAELPDGQWLLAVVGRGRLRVRRWLPDDPYPCAEVQDLDDSGFEDAGFEGAGRDEVKRLLRRALALQTELGEAAAPATFELDADPGRALYQAAALAPIGPADAQRVLEADDPVERRTRLVEALAGAVDLLARRLSGR